MLYAYFSPHRIFFKFKVSSRVKLRKLIFYINTYCEMHFYVKLAVFLPYVVSECIVTTVTALICVRYNITCFLYSECKCQLSSKKATRYKIVIQHFKYFCTICVY